MRFLQKPRGLWRVDEAFPPGYANRPENAVTVNLCGADVDGISVEADPARDYDWTRLRAFYVVVAVRKGIDATRTVKALLPIASPYLMLHDVDTGYAASVLQVVPKLKLWHHSPRAVEAMRALYARDAVMEIA